MTEAWIASLAAQALLAWRLAPGPVRQYMAWQVAGQIALLPLYGRPEVYRWAWFLWMAVDALMAAYACRWRTNPVIAIGTAALPLAVGLGSSIHFGRPFSSPYSARFALPLLGTCWTLGGASGWLLAYAALRYFGQLAGWWQWFSAPALYESIQWAQAALFAGWAFNRQRTLAS